MDIKKIYNFILKHKILSHAFHLSPVLITGLGVIMYPIWWMDGTLNGDSFADELYLKIGLAIASYGGFIGHLVWYFQNIRRF
jgi:hypothetical protein